MLRSRVARVALAAAVVGVLAACAGGAGDADGTGGPGPATPSTADALESGTITVFAAASLTDAFEELAARFEERHPEVDVVLNLGGSAALAQQVVAGAPADVFAAAAEPPMATVVDAGLADDATVFATNTLELAVPTGNPAGIAGLDDLAREELRIALCDESVPCGAAAATLLDEAGVDAAPDTLESDVKAVLTKVALGEVDAGLVYRTDVRSSGGSVEGIDVPAAASVVNRYPIAALAEAPHPAAAAAFTAFVTGPEGRDVLDRLGFGAP
ncbi:molybdate-binding protein [Agromyces luteolus]|uniref:Molybdate ABC transporter substrate-binding protein n=1 Tax=Agromyces luteolus TaxID=88373 RepID=A0A7C9LG99_9MICO|nr:molybdate ABC transporter substrate-binding protein [Agromyces luteolus]MUN06835.1 molybdate ABC transporter substrate-binding protein [Agromyces luteolus]GLK29082.1 molybdate-binding protein [Agromyces luteolus]